jgi:two-component system sensor histidine kinase UhpB
MSLRHLIADLRPSHLDDLGLPSTLRWYARDVQQRVPFDIHVELQGDERPLASAVNTALFRVAQEALTNIIKYAQARTAWIACAIRQKKLLQVEDDGIGFDTSTELLSRRSAGIAGYARTRRTAGRSF